jgi:ferredoxin-NADP reductase/ferredoxin
MPVQLSIRVPVLAWFFVAACFLLPIHEARAEMSPEEHASHHPGAAPAAGAIPENAPAGGMSATVGAPGMAGMGPPAGVGPPAGGKPPAGAGGMMGAGGMGAMMEKMGAPKPRDMYPSLMSLPELTPEKRREVEQQAAERISAGSMIMGQALDALIIGTQSDNYAAMHEATTVLREGIAQFESGVAAKRALMEGRAPRQVALAWFKQEMSLVTPLVGGAAAADGGLSFFHIFTMVLLVAFALAMLAMYFFKMRRATALFGRVDPDKGSPPPGSAPPLAGGPGPSGGKPSPPGGAPHAEKPHADAPTADKAPAPGETSDPPKAPVSPDTKPPGEPAASTSSSGAPLTEKWAGKLRVESIVNETPLVTTFRFRAPDGGSLPFIYTPGQFLNVAFGIGGARMFRSYSISSSPHERDFVELTIKREPRGAVSRHFTDLLKVGDDINAGGPAGKFTFTGAEADSVVLLSAGVGITPMMSIARYLTEQSWPGDIYFIYSCRTEADFIFQKAITDLEQRNPKLHVVVTMSKPGPNWKGPRGRINKELLTAAVPKLASRRVHVCGPVTMMDGAKAMLTELGVAAENLKSEQFGAVKPAPANPGTTVKPESAATGPLITFSKNNKSAKIRVDLQNGDSPPKQSILELSEELGIGIDFSCRIGTCGVCKVKMTSGEVDQEVQDALDEDDKKNGIILACQAKPKAEVMVEA